MASKLTTKSAREFKYNQVMDISILKRDGSTESFQPEKIVRVLLAAGLEEDSTQAIADHVAAWAAGLNEPQITSLQIRDQVQAELDQVNSYIAGLFRWYQKTKQPSA